MFVKKCHFSKKNPKLFFRKKTIVVQVTLEFDFLKSF